MSKNEMSAHNAEKYSFFGWLKNIHPSIIIFILILIFLGKHVVPIGGNFIGGSDVEAYHFWNIAFLKEQILSGSFPLWNPYMYCGHPFLANPANFVLYPFILLYILFPISWASNFDILVHLFIAGMGAYYMVYIITESKAAALSSAIVYSLSGHMIDSIYAGHLTKIHAAALLPWIFYCIEKVFKTGQMKHLIVAGLFLGLQILTGNNQDNLYTSIFISLYFVLRYFVTFRKFEFQHFLGYMVYFLLVPLISFGVSAAQLIPTLEFISLSDRAQETYEFATQGSFTFQNFFTFLAPKPSSGLLNTNWEFGCYVGILSILISLIGLSFSRARHMILCLLILLLISLTFMMGSNTPLYLLYFKVLPFIPRIRVPARSLIIFVFFLSILVGMGVQYLIENPDKKKLFYFLITSFPVLAIILFWGAHAFQISLSSRSMILAFFLTGTAFTILVASIYLKNRQLIAGLIIAALFVDLYLVYAPTIPTLNNNELLQEQDYEKVLKSDKDFFRVNIPLIVSSLNIDMASRGNVFHYYNVDGYIPLALKDFYQFMHIMAGIPVPILLRHTLDINLFRPELVFSSKVLGIKYAIISTQEGIRMIQAKWYMPRAILLRNALIIPNHEDHLTYLKNPGFNPTQTILLEKDINNFSQTLSSAQANRAVTDSVQITSYSPNRIELRSESVGNNYLLLSELFYPGWHAYVNGNKVPILRADYLLRTIQLPSGYNHVVFIYRPMCLIFGCMITGVTLLILIFLYFYQRKRVME